jgi:hypothetical protein
MNTKRSLQNRIRGWFPQEPRLAYAVKATKPRWRKPVWIALSLIAITAVAFIAYTGVQTFIRYSNPQSDVTANYFEKALNCTSANVGDVVEVKVMVNWHGYILPEFKRQVQIIDAYPDGNFELVSGNNTHQYNGYGGGEAFQYLLKVTNGTDAPIELPKPKLILDGAEIPLTGANTSLELTIISEEEK